jgi:hypothetical protein
MSIKLNALLEKRETLRQKSHEERERLSTQLRQWDKPLSFLDKGLSLIDLIKKNRAGLSASLKILNAYQVSQKGKLILATQIALKMLNSLKRVNSKV